MVEESSYIYIYIYIHTRYLYLFNYLTILLGMCSHPVPHTLNYYMKEFLKDDPKMLTVPKVLRLCFIFSLLQLSTLIWCYYYILLLSKSIIISLATITSYRTTIDHHCLSLDFLIVTTITEPIGHYNCHRPPLAHGHHHCNYSTL